jgi:pimeloyl-ACP methyl ester carboxylesterase
MTSWRTGTVASGGETIYYEVIGDAGAPTVLLTHGAGGSHAIWFQQVPALAAAGYRVVTWDCRGFGKSSFDSGVHGCDAAVADMTAVLAEVGAARAHLVGQSMGGWWVTAFTLAHPERVATLTLSNTIGGLWTDELFAHFGTLGRPAEETEVTIGAHPAISPAFAARDPERAFLYQELNTFHAPPMAAIMTALVGARFEHTALNALAVPMLVISSRDDQLFPPRLVAESARELEHASYFEVRDAGHSTYFERPDEYNAALLDFLGKHPG